MSRLSNSSALFLKKLDTDSSYIKFMNVVDYFEYATSSQPRFYASVMKDFPSIDAYVLSEYESLDLMVAVILSQITDEITSVLSTADFKCWVFTDRSSALRSIKRLNSNITVYFDPLLVS